MIASDDAVLDEILRLAAAVGCEVERLSDLGAARDRWASAPLVLVDEAAVAGAGPALPRRAGVLLVCAADPEPATWQRAFALGVEQVVALPEGEAGLATALADVAEGPGAPGGRVVAALGGRGGAGASVLAAALAVGACRAGDDALLVDCDPLGGGADVVFGLECATGLRWPALRVRSGRVSMAELASALPGRRYGGGMLSVLSCDRDGPGPEPEALAAVVEAGRRAGRTVVCDLPRRFDSAGREALGHADLVVVVLPAEVRACVAAKRVVEQIGDRLDRVRVLVRGPAGAVLTGAEVADAVGVPLLGWMRPERGLTRMLEHGEFDPKPGGPLGRAARTMLAALTT
ncbi:septum site-determining protein Ssd [Prauserella shujinwangii]|uniref:septum site-determining protein Ssd n=1 Tax=Prauserella shujinwangii TaxID=1453103 RepID=UPI003182E109